LIQQQQEMVNKNPPIGAEIHAANEEHIGSGLLQAEAHNDSTEHKDDAHEPNQVTGQRGQEEIHK
jgi:hypothetical protein